MQLDVGKGTKRPPPRRWGLLGRPLLVLVALVAVGVLAAGCSGGMGGSGSGGTAPASGGVSGVAMVSAASTGLGMILVDGSGRTLYVFAKDQPDLSARAGAYVAAWPVDRSSGAPTAGSGVTGSMLGTIRRGDGSSQVTYHQHPLYYFHGDSGAGQQTARAWMPSVPRVRGEPGRWCRHRHRPPGGGQRAGAVLLYR